MGRVRRRLGVILLAFAQLACLELPELSSAICGDGFLDTGEDCDGERITVGGRSYACSDACRLSCAPIACAGKVQYDGSPAVESCCPSGWGCGADGVCRESAGQFLPGVPIDANVRRLATADFDGDYRNDVLVFGPAEVGIHYFDSSERVQSSVINIPVQASAYGDVTSDRRADLVLSINGGLGVLQGDEARSLRPLAYPAKVFTQQIEERFRAVFASYPGENGPVNVPYLVTEEHLILTVWSSAELPWPAGRAVVDWPIAVARLPQQSDCELLVVPIEDGSAEEPEAMLLLVDLCATEFFKEIPLGAGRIAGPVQAYDDNGDGSTDGLAVGLDDGVSVRLDFIALGAAEPVVSGSLRTFDASTEVSCAQSRPVPLAIGDLDGDCMLDFVDSCKIWLSNNPQTDPLVCPPQELAQPRTYNNVQSPWSSALISDFDYDGDVDVVASSGGSTGLSYFRNGGQVFDPAFIPTKSAVAELARGDFDGDLISDIAIMGQRTSLGEASLQVAFGRFLGLPEASVDAGELRDGEHLFAADIALFGLASDGMTDLGVMTHRGASASMVIFPGNAGRLMQSTLRLTTDAEAGSIGDEPKQIALGSFGELMGDAEGGRTEIAALSFQGETGVRRLWRHPLDEQGLPLGSGILPLDNQALPFLQTALMTSIREPDAAHDRLVVLGDELTEDQMAVRSVLRTASPNGSGAFTLGSPRELPSNGVLDAETQLAAADIDGDGAPDASLVARKWEDYYTPFVEVVWGPLDAAGDLASTPIETCPAVDGMHYPVSGVVWGNLDSDKELEGVVMAEGGACFVDIVGHGCAGFRGSSGPCFGVTPLKLDDIAAIPGAGDPSRPAPPLPGQQPRPASLAIGDVDGNGLPDLIIGLEGQIRVLFHQARNP